MIWVVFPRVEVRGDEVVVLVDEGEGLWRPCWTLSREHALTMGRLLVEASGLEEGDGE